MSDPVIIFDNGSGYLKAGLSTEREPSVNIPALIGRPMLRYAEILEDVELKPIMIGDEVIPVRSLLDLSYPIAEGVIKNDEDLTLLWDYALEKKLNINTKELGDRRMLLTEAPNNPTKNKMKMGEILFEHLGFGYFNIEPQAKLTIYCEGLQTGIVLDSGDGVSHVIPIALDFLLQHSIKRLDIAGRHITNYLIRLLQIKGYAFNSTADFEVIREVKEKHCFVSCDIASDRKLDKETTYYNTFKKLPDGRKIMISSEKFEAPEILFAPYLDGGEQDGIHEMLFKSINSCDIDLRKDLYGNIVLSGASTMFPGYASRIEKEIRELFVKNNLKQAKDKNIKMKINIIDSPRRKISVFIGATVLAEICKQNDDYWITKKDWDECGPEIIKKKCSNVIN